MPLPLSLIVTAAEVMRQEAIRNKRLRSATRVRMLLQAQQMPFHWLGRILLERALEEKKPYRGQSLGADPMRRPAAGNAYSSRP
jgi:hypothetical protein